MVKRAPKGPDRHVSLATIARSAGVSPMVVSAVINGAGTGRVFFSAATRDKVLAAAARLDYRPNRAAAQLRQGRHGQIAVLANDVFAVGDMAMLGILCEARAQDALVLFELRAHDAEGPPTVFREHCCDGIIAVQDYPELDGKTPGGPPFVRLNTNVRDRPGCITVDEHGGSLLAVRRLAAAKRKRIAYIGVATTHYSEAARLAGLSQACRECGIEAPLHHLLATGRSNEDLAPARGPLNRFLRDHPEIDALVLYGPNFAHLVYEAATGNDRAIGVDLDVIAFGDSPVAKAVLPALTVVSYDAYAMGRLAVRTLSEVIAGRPVEPVAVEYRLIERASVSGAPKPGRRGDP
jgi:LacI family transcriptional regulator